MTRYSLYILVSARFGIPAKIGDKSKSVCEDIRKCITESAVVGADETGEYVNGALHWLRIGTEAISR